MSTIAFKLGCAILLAAFVACFALAPLETSAFCLVLLLYLSIVIIAVFSGTVSERRNKRRAHELFWNTYNGKFLLIVSRRRWGAFLDNSVLPALRADEICISFKDNEWNRGTGLHIAPMLAIWNRPKPPRPGWWPIWIDLRDGEIRIHSLHHELRPLEERGRKRATSTAAEVRAVLDRYRAPCGHRPKDTPIPS